MKILIADDDPVCRKLLIESLGKWEYEVEECKDGVEAWEKMQSENAPRLVILDWLMPGMDGVEVCRKIRKLERESYIYILLLTIKDQKDDIIKGLEAGADDYITKPFFSHELKVRLRAGRRILEMNDGLLETRDILQKQATHDALTGIWNRRAILQAFKAEMDRSQREKKNLSVALLDIDHFKNVNDTYGHLAGDQVLRETVKRMRSQLRPYDSLGRYGGEEFLLILPGCDKDGAVRQAERLRTSVCEKSIDTSGGIIHLTISAGLCVITNGKIGQMEQFIHSADQALYRAKEGGRNRIEVSIIEQ